jgi:Glycosyl transferase family 2
MKLNQNLVNFLSQFQTKFSVLTFIHQEFVDTSKVLDIFHDERLGEMGRKVTMPSILPLEVKKMYNEGWKNHKFNQYLSDLISVRRSLPDVRSDYCKKVELNYSKSLPKTSVIIIFYNEAWSTLLRSVHSVLDLSPDHLLEEIILVDDFSDMRKVFNLQMAIFKHSFHFQRISTNHSMNTCCSTRKSKLFAAKIAVV